MHGIIEFRAKTFIATGTTTVCCFMTRRASHELQLAAARLIALEEDTAAELSDGLVDLNELHAGLDALPERTADALVNNAYDSDILAHALRVLADGVSEVIVGFSGDSVQDQQSILGYRFSTSRGGEGYGVLEVDGVPQTHLYDPISLTNQRRFSGAVLARFEGRDNEIPAEDDEIAKFMVSVPTRDLWRMPGGTIENPSAFFISDETVASSSPHGDFIDDLDCDEQTIGTWLESGRCALVRGAIYPKALETPRPTETRILTASNLNLSTRTITHQQYRYLRNADTVTATQKPTTGDIVICTASGSLKHLGKIAVVSAPVDAYIGGFLAILRCPDAFDQQVLEFNLLSARFRRMVAAAKEQNINNLTEGKLGVFRLRVPRDREGFVAALRERQEGERPAVDG